MIYCCCLSFKGGGWKFEDTKIKERPTIQWPQEKDKQWSTKHYTEN